MSVRIRLQRHGKKGKPFYHIVAADTRSKRDGRFIEKLGTYNPNTNPATIDIHFDRTLDWLLKGAQPSDTARAILSYKGVLLKRHLVEGVKKGALTEEQAEQKFQIWLEEKESKVSAKVQSVADHKAKQEKSRLENEQEVDKARAAALAAKKSPLAEEVAAEDAPVAAEEEAPKEARTLDEVAAEAANEGKPKAEEAAPEAPAAEEVKAEESAPEAPAAEEVKAEEAAPEAPAAEEVKAEESAPEAPAAEEPKAEEKPAEESKDA